MAVGVTDPLVSRTYRESAQERVPDGPSKRRKRQGQRIDLTSGHNAQTSTVAEAIAAEHGINEKTVEALDAPLTLWQPELGAIIDAAATAGARVIGFDIVLPDRSYDVFLDRFFVDADEDLQDQGVHFLVSYRFF